MFVLISPRRRALVYQRLCESVLTAGGASNCSPEGLQGEQEKSAAGKVTRIDLKIGTGSH